MKPRRRDEDYESNDVEGAAHLAREDADPHDYDKPSRAELAAEAEADRRDDR